MIEKRVFIQCDACGRCETLEELDLETSEKWHGTHRLTDDGERENVLKSLAKLVKEYK